MGKPSRRRGKKGRGGGSASGQAAAAEGADDSTASTSAADLAINNVSVSLRAKLDFHEATADIDSCLTADPDAPPGEFIRYTIAQWSRKKCVLNWFNAGCARDPTAELWVDLASKDTRRDLHRMIEKDFAHLKSLSRGLDGQRRLLVLHQSNTTWDVEPLSAEDEKKASVLRATLRDQNQECSVDQATEMIRENTITEEQGKLLAKAMADQKALEVLLDGIKGSDVAAVEKALEAAPTLLSERIKHYETGDAPLHVASAGGSTTIIKKLMEAGADVHQRDGKGRTALKVALAAEQCDAEGMLIQSGAFDPDADKDLQAELDLEQHHPSSDLEEVAAPVTAVMPAAAASAETLTAVPSTPPQESAERPAADEKASVAPVETSAAGKVDDPKVDASAPPADLTGAMKSVAEAAHTAVDATDGAVPPVNSAAKVNGAISEGRPSGITVTDRAQAPATISEIQPASPRPEADEDVEDHRMTLSRDAEQESGVGVLLDYVQTKTENVVEWCKTHQGVAGTVFLSAAAVGVAALTMLTKKR